MQSTPSEPSAPSGNDSKTGQMKLTRRLPGTSYPALPRKRQSPDLPGNDIQFLPEAIFNLPGETACPGVSVCPARQQIAVIRPGCFPGASANEKLTAFSGSLWFPAYPDSLLRRRSTYIFQKLIWRPHKTRKHPTSHLKAIVIPRHLSGKMLYPAFPGCLLPCNFRNDFKSRLLRNSDAFQAPSDPK